jgi:hypothetical protein
MRVALFMDWVSFIGLDNARNPVLPVPPFEKYPAPRLPASQIRPDGFEWINGFINYPVTYSSQGRGRFFQKF